MKIGILVRDTFPRLIESGLLSNEDINYLQDKRYSKNTFDLNYPFLKKVDHSKNIKEQRLVNYYPRYYAKPLRINGEDYFVTSEWYERSKGRYVNWLMSKGVKVTN